MGKVVFYQLPKEEYEQLGLLINSNVDKSTVAFDDKIDKATEVAIVASVDHAKEVLAVNGLTRVVMLGEVPAMGEEAFNQARAVFQAGVTSYVSPQEPIQVMEAVQNAYFEKKNLTTFLNELSPEPIKAIQSDKIQLEGFVNNRMIGTSPATHKVLDHLATLSEYKFDIFISGESGAGKEVASDVYIDNRLRRIASDLLHGKGDIFYKNPAMKDLTKAVMPPIDFKALDANKREEEITNLANRLRGPLVFKDNIAAYSDELFKSTISGYIKGAFTGADKDTPGLLEKYNYGIIQFDEVGYLSLAKQEIMMRIADNREYTQVGGNQVKNFDIQFVFSTRFDLDDLVRQGKMLEDFAARIQKLQVIVPPLRERSEDIPLLAQHMVAKLNKDSNKSKSIDADTLSILSKMKLPTNVRQLDTIIRNLYTKERGSVITVHTLKNYLTDLMDQEKAKELRPQNLSTLTSVKEAMPGVEKGAAITR